MKPIVTGVDPIHTRQLSTTPLWPIALQVGTGIVDMFSNWQLGFGTLLGAVRDGTVIPHDIDLDIDVLLNDEEEWIEEFDAGMQDSGFTPLRMQRFPYLDTELVMSLAYNYKDTGIIFDVCFFRRVGSDFLHVGKEGVVIRPFWSAERRPIALGGVVCHCPIRSV